MNKTFNGEHAAHLLAFGKVVRRKFWDKGSFVYMQVPSTIPSDIIPKMTSVPMEAKNVFAKRVGLPLTYKNQLALVDMDNCTTTYTFTTEDIYALDWEVYNGNDAI